MSAFQALGIFLLVFLGTSLLFKLPMAFSMGLTCVAMIVFVGQPSLSLAQTSFASLDSFPFLAIPFFVFAGALMQYSGISTSLVNFIQAFVGRLRGSLGALLVLTSMAFGVLTGSTVATLSSIGKMMVPELVKHGYKKSYASALAAASGFLGILIPPSVPGIFYALAAGQNIAEVWIATAGPAIFIGLGYIIVNFLIHGRNEAKATEPLIFKSFTKNIVKQTKNALPALLMPIIIFGGIYGGAFTPTEAGAVCGVYGIVYYIIKKLRGNKMDRTMWWIAVESAGMTAVIALGAAFSNAGGRMLTRVGVSHALAEFITSNISSPIAFLLLCNLIFLFLGMLIDINASILIMTPLLLPSVIAFGIDPVHFGAIMLVNLCVGYLTPPMAGSIFFICRLCDESFVDVVREAWPFIIVGFLAILATTFIPDLSLRLVHLVG
ncbi:MAG TPA: TRAP transporter large permease [Thermoanaerobacterales bacterium]|jgi:C4-dicarboxylate transporter DctM subunit|nr:TRAP transporter large permease [Thermoanaerobacterales bacterium]